MDFFVWYNEVRAHEIDVQGIVNNAHYLSYFDHARTVHLNALGVNWVQLSQEGLNLVLAHTEIKFLAPLRAFDRFKVESFIRQEGKLKLIFEQKIMNEESLLTCSSINTIVCVDTKRNKPITIDKLKTFFKQQNSPEVAQNFL
ncbi:acyl-CoA thioesterase [Legionella nautarum]|uniref:Acyl-CoA thioesterase n=1 Tax=Legionella nautarum TaxID=45070 RepID=A0A0W0WK76_9GAMM|nr:thioesterase family protein [Legionella nautarum]KTD32728.1 acyl-CoA thioesterase [Legionella nautarum]